MYIALPSRCRRAYEVNRVTCLKYISIWKLDTSASDDMAFNGSDKAMEWRL
ncbi:MAG: hypothetical protein K0S04_4013 [Herbinix sp.]|jgi:hypothetical protein|nr:hypothetical protein [Herbinix sp.]